MGSSFKAGGSATPDDLTPRYQTKAQLAAEALRNLIRQGELPPGKSIDLDLVRQRLQMSSTPIREALRMLEAEGLVVNEPHHESRVSNFTASDAVELYELRVHLEGYATRLAVPNLGDEEVAELKRIANLHNKSVDARDMPGMVRYNQAWHMLIYRSAAKSSFLYEFIGMLWNAFPWTTAWMDPKRAVRSVKEHKKIMAAILDHDAALAEAAMREHVLAGKEFVVNKLSKGVFDRADGSI